MKTTDYSIVGFHHLAVFVSGVFIDYRGHYLVNGGTVGVQNLVMLISDYRDH